MPSFISKVKKKFKSGAWYPFYNTFYEKVPVDKKEILLVSRSGLALESNILALFCFSEQPGLYKILYIPADSVPLK